MRRGWFIALYSMGVFFYTPPLSANEYKVVLGSYNTLESADNRLKKLEKEFTGDYWGIQNKYGCKIVARSSGRAFLIAAEPLKSREDAFAVRKRFRSLFSDAYIDKYYGTKSSEIIDEVLRSKKVQLLDNTTNTENNLTHSESGLDQQKSRDHKLENVSLTSPNVDFFIENFIAESIVNSPSILSKISMVNSALSSEEAAKWQYFPTPTLSTEQGKGGERTSIARLQQPLWSGGRIDAEYNKAKSTTGAAKMSVDEIRQNVILSISQAFNSVITAYGHVLVYRDAIARLEKHKEMIVRRITQGISPQSELLLVNARLVQAKTDYSIALAAQERALAGLEQWVSRKVTISELSPILPQESCSAHLPPVYQNNHFLEEVLTSHPGVLRYNEQIRAAQYDVEIKKAALMPNLYAKVEKQWSSVSPDSGDPILFNIGIQYTPGAGLSSLSAVEAARANLIALENDKKAFEYELKQKVSSEWSDYLFTSQRYENYLIAIDSTQKTAESYERLFIAGKRSWLDVLNAEREWMTAQITLSDVQAYLISTPVRLKIYANEMIWLKGNK